MQRRAGLDERVIGVQLGTEINAFFHVGISRGEFTSNRKVSSPRAAATRHRDFKFRLRVLRKETPADFFKPFQNAFVNSVIHDIKESEITASLSDLPRDIVPVFGAGSEGANVDDRNLQGEGSLETYYRPGRPKHWESLWHRRDPSLIQVIIRGASLEFLYDLANPGSPTLTFIFGDVLPTSFQLSGLLSPVETDGFAFESVTEASSGQDVPEPSTLVLLVAGSTLAFCFARRRVCWHSTEQ